MQLRGAMLYVRDLERMKRFYGDMLGIEATNQNWENAWAIFDTGDVRFALHAIPAGISDHIEIACPPVPREQEPVKLIFEVKDVEGERERLESLGVQTLRRPWQQSGEACDAVDPEGNIFQLCSSGTDALR
jgi:predicted enzyme related to lactoylglutathione lyase